MEGDLAQTEKKEATWQQRQRLEQCGHKPGIAGSHQKLAGAGTDSSGAFGGSSPAVTLILATQDPRWTSDLHNWERINLSCLSHWVCGNLLTAVMGNPCSDRDRGHQPSARPQVHSHWLQGPICSTPFFVSFGDRWRVEDRGVFFLKHCCSPFTKKKWGYLLIRKCSFRSSIFRFWSHFWWEDTAHPTLSWAGVKGAERPWHWCSPAACSTGVCQHGSGQSGTLDHPFLPQDPCHLRYGHGISCTIWVVGYDEDKRRGKGREALES